LAFFIGLIKKNDSHGYFMDNCLESRTLANSLQPEYALRSHALSAIFLN